MKFILKHRIVIIIFLILLTLPFAMGIKLLTRDAGISSLLPEDDPDYIYYKETEELFGSADQVVIGLKFQDSVYTEQNIRLINNVTEFLKSLDEIDKDDVLSLTTVDDMEGKQGELIINPLVENDHSLDSTTLQDPVLRFLFRAWPLPRP